MKSCANYKITVFVLQIITEVLVSMSYFYGILTLCHNPNFIGIHILHSKNSKKRFKVLQFHTAGIGEYKTGVGAYIIEVGAKRAVLCTISD